MAAEMTTRICGTVKSFIEAVSTVAGLEDTMVNMTPDVHILPKGFLNKNVDFRQYMTTGYPRNYDGNCELVNDSEIHLTCEEGHLDDKPEVRLIIAPKADNARYYCAFGTVNLDDYHERLCEADYDKIKTLRLRRMTCTTGVASRLHWYKVLKAIASLMDKKSRILSSLGGSKLEFFEKMFGRTINYGTWTPHTDDEQRACRKILEELFPDMYDLKEIMRDYLVLDTLRSCFALPQVQELEQQAGVMLVPSQLFAAMAAMVEQGWYPLVPMWMGPKASIYNGRYDRGCGGGSFEGAGEIRANSVEQRMFHNAFNVFTLHIPAHAYLETTIEPDAEWEDDFIRACTNLAQTPARDMTTDLQSWGLRAARDVPLAVLTPESTEYWKITRAKHYTDGRHADDYLEVQDRQGNMVIGNLPAPANVLPTTPATPATEPVTEDTEAINA